MHRYAKLGYVALNVSDLERSKTFYRDLWGLDLTETAPSGEHFLRCSDDHHNLILYKGTPGLKRIGWQMASESDLDQLGERIQKAGQKISEVDAKERAFLHQGRSLRFSCPFTGTTHEYYVDQRQLGGTPYKWTVAKIQRLGHIVLKTPRYEEALKFYMDVLNFKASDAVDTFITFMRCWPNPYHHSFGLAKSSTDQGQLHHFNFMVTEDDDIGKGMWRFKKNDVPIVRGPGRHPPSGSMFLYMLDPDNITVEYSFGMETFPEENARRPRILPPIDESIDYWGSPMDPRMGAYGPIEVDKELAAGRKAA